MSSSPWPNVILAAVDGSASARRGLARAAALALAAGCKLRIVTAVPNQLFGYRAGYFSFVDRHATEELRKVADALLQEARQEALAAGITQVESEAIEGGGDVFEQLAQHIEQRGPVDLVVVGSFGHAVGDRLILGSTTQRLILELSRRGLATATLVVP